MAVGTDGPNQISNCAFTGGNTWPGGAGLVEITVGGTVLGALHGVPHIGDTAREAALWRTLQIFKGLKQRDLGSQTALLSGHRPPESCHR